MGRGCQIYSKPSQDQPLHRARIGPLAGRRGRVPDAGWREVRVLRLMNYSYILSTTCNGGCPGLSRLGQGFVCRASWPLSARYPCLDTTCHVRSTDRGQIKVVDILAGESSPAQSSPASRCKVQGARCSSIGASNLTHCAMLVIGIRALENGGAWSLVLFCYSMHFHGG